jgi:RimJ/RimL family protein N-acetyltransferase
VTLSDGTIRLERLGAEHLSSLADLGHDVDVQRYTYVPSPWEDGFERTWLARYEHGHVDGTRAGFAIVDDESGDFLGLAALVDIDRQGNQAEAGYIVAPQARGRGVAGRALQLLTGWALRDLGLARVELRITADNPASIRVAERAGFVREGVLRSVHLKQGIRTDMAIYSQIAGDER